MKKNLLALVFMAGTALFPLHAAHAQIVLENVRVRLPTGQVITINDGPNWHQDERVVVYKRYYYDPRARVYVVYDRDYTRPMPPGWYKHRRDQGGRNDDRGRGYGNHR